MPAFKSLISLLLLLAALASFAGAAPTPSASAPAANSEIAPDLYALLDQAAAAMGVAHQAELRAIHADVVQRVEVDKDKPLEYKGELYADIATGYYQRSFDLDGIPYRQGFDAQGAWSAMDNGVPTYYPDGNVLVELMAFVYSGAALAPNARITQTYQWLRSAPCGDSVCDVLHPHGKQVPDIDIWFRRDTHLIDRAVFHFKGKTPLVFWLGDWVAVNGYFLPQSYSYATAARHFSFSARYQAAEIKPLRQLQMPEPDDWAIADGADHAVVPITVAHDMINIPVSINGKPGYHIQLDTGADLVLNEDVLKTLKIKTRPYGQSGGMGGRDVDTGRSEALDLSMGNLQLKQWHARTIDMGRLNATEDDAEHSLGLIGTDLLARFVVQIDFDHNQMLLYPPRHFHYSGKARPLVLSDAFERLTVEANLEGEKGVYLLDTGYAGSLGINAPYVRQHNLFNRLRCTPERTLSEGIGGNVFGRRATVDSFTLDGVVLPSLGVDLHSMRSGMAADDRIAGLVGLGVLHRFNLIFDMPRHELYLEKNSHFNEADPFPVSMAEIM